MIRARETGVSTEDYVYKTFRCIYCAKPVLATDETFHIMLRERIGRWRQEGHHWEEEPSVDLVDEWRATLNKEWRGHAIGFRQYIHNHCMVELSQMADSQREQYERQFRLHNRENIIVPDTLVDVDGSNPYVIYSSKLYPLPDYRRSPEWCCRYCDQDISDERPGFSYKKKTKLTPAKRHLHFECYEYLREKNEGRTQENIRFWDELANKVAPSEPVQQQAVPEPIVLPEPEPKQKQTVETFEDVEDVQEEIDENVEKEDVDVEKAQIESLKSSATETYKDLLFRATNFNLVYNHMVDPEREEPSDDSIDEFNANLRQFKKDIDDFEAHLDDNKLPNYTSDERLVKWRYRNELTLEAIQEERRGESQARKERNEAELLELERAFNSLSVANNGRIALYKRILAKEGPPDEALIAQYNSLVRELKKDAFALSNRIGEYVDDGNEKPDFDYDLVQIAALPYLTAAAVIDARPKSQQKELSSRKKKTKK